MTDKTAETKVICYIQFSNVHMKPSDRLAKTFVNANLTSAAFFFKNTNMH